MEKIITNKLLKNFEKRYQKNINNKIIENSIIKNGIRMSSLNNDVVKKHNFEFSVETKLGAITNQKNSGRCWIFASLNMARLSIMKELNVESIELSQNYIAFYDYLEKANRYLNFIVEKGLSLDTNDRMFCYYNDSPVDDGGYYEWFSDLIKKYGICTKSAMPETFQSESTSSMFKEINWRLKAYVAKMRIIFNEQNKITSEIEELKEKALEDVYNILVKSLGIPPKEFTFEYHDKDKKYHFISETPASFYEKYVKNTLDDMITIISDPREKYPYNRLLHSNYVKNMYEGTGINKLNVSIETQKQAIINSLKDGNAVWFGCDVGTYSDNKLGIMDNDLFITDLTLPKILSFSKKEKFELRASFISHAMNLVGVDLDKNEQPINWKVENSWGDEVGKKGIFSMSDAWFTEYNYEAIVNKKYLPEEALRGLNEEAIELEPFDPIC